MKSFVEITEAEVVQVHEKVALSLGVLPSPPTSDLRHALVQAYSAPSHSLGCPAHLYCAAVLLQTTVRQPFLTANNPTGYASASAAFKKNGLLLRMSKREAVDLMNEIERRSTPPTMTLYEIVTAFERVTELWHQP